ncbi:MAG: succinyl-diaminopimelate desuccinylase [Acidimicrobiia bacterium]|nr:succinyl-diaminopimelate desuccinylase [Acidimicrobiia bacterium]
MTDLLSFTAELVDIPSVSHQEGAITDHLELLLRAVPWLHVERVGQNLVARTAGTGPRLLLAGHTDTVPANGNERARIDGDVLWGLGSADMKSGVAVLVELARTVERPAIPVTYVFYECEEVEAKYNGIERLFCERPELMVADAAILAEPTAALVEAGCQGTMRLVATFNGERAHTARAWLGRNAIHRLGDVLQRLSSYIPREVDIDGCRFREGVQAVIVEGGVAHNVVPDRAVLTVNHRFAPDRTPEEAEAFARGLLAEADEVEVTDMAPPAPPSLDHPLLAGLLRRVGQPPAGKLGWTDVGRFAGRGVPATNFGPGDPKLAHHADERVARAELDRAFGVLRSLIEDGVKEPA